MILYVAGPMSGFPGYNYAQFRAAAGALRDRGYGVLNPADNPLCDSWQGYMRAGLRQVADADGVALLDDWQASRGAALEVHVAHALGLRTHPLRVWLDSAP